MPTPPRRSVFRPLFLLVAVATSLSAQEPASSGLVELQILPSRTDPAIRTFDQPHVVRLNRDIVVERRPGLPAPRGQLLLFLPGTVPPSAAPAAKSPDRRPATKSPSAGGSGGASAFCELAAQLGYHVIFLRYPNDTSASAATNDEDPAEFERFRMALIAGGTSRHLSIPRHESIEHRLIKLLETLQRLRPRENWAQFLTPEGGIRWRAIAVAGQSQGGGHAVLIAKKHEVARAIATGAVKDYSRRHRRPAPWLEAESATPPARIFTFNHVQDRQAANLEQQRENHRALRLHTIAPEANVDTAPPPYGRSRMLFTDYPGGKTLTSREAHTAVISSANARVFEPVWRYLLTAEAP